MVATDADGGQASDYFAFENQPSEVDEPIFFDQTTRHMGSIQKNMVLTDSHKNQLLEQGFGGRPGFATKAMVSAKASYLARACASALLEDALLLQSLATT